MPLSPEDLAQLSRRHLAFLSARLVSAEAEAEWRENAGAVLTALLRARVGEIVDSGALADALDAALTPEAIDRAARPLGARLLPLVLRELGAEPGKLDARLPVAARPKLAVLVAHPGVFPDRILRELAEQDAVEEVMRDVLYDGFKEFSEKVNPFTAEWGVPSLLKRMSLLGGAMTKGLDAVKVELDKRTEPEIRRFLGGFTRKGLRRMVEITVSRADTPASAALRRHMLAWVLDQEIAALARGADAAALALGLEVAMDVAASELGREERRAQRRRLIEEAVAAAKDRTVEEALLALGVTLRPDVEAIAAATWPLAKAVLGSEAVRRWLEKMTREFYDREGLSA